MGNIISKDKCIYEMSRNNQPVLKVKSGDVVVFETNDCFEGQITSSEQNIEALDWSRINPATGPLHVEGAEQGDTLKIEILKIDIDDYGVMAAIPGSGLLGDKISKSEIKIIPIIENKAKFNEKISLPISPMIGVIGVAPADGAISCGSPDSHGGNMDNTLIKEGSTLYLPVAVEGALLSIGDLHASMGDGEIMVTGVEIAGKVTVKVEVIKGKKINNPILDYKNSFYTIASDENLLAAVRTATEDMLDIVIKQNNLSFNEAGMLLSAIGNVEICQVVDPKLTVRYSMPKSILNSVL